METKTTFGLPPDGAVTTELILLNASSRDSQLKLPSEFILRNLRMSSFGMFIFGLV